MHAFPLSFLRASKLSLWFAFGIVGVITQSVAQSIEQPVSAPSASSAAAPAVQLAALADRYIDGVFELNPVLATWLGESRYAGKFVDNLTPEFRLRERRLQEGTLAALNKIDVRQLTHADALTHQVLAYRASMRLEELQYDFHLTPFNQFYSVPLTLVQFASTAGAQPFRTVADYEAFLQRLAGFPGWVDSAIANMREGMTRQVVQPKVLMNRVLTQLKTQIVADPELSGFYVPVKKFPATFAEADRTRLAVAYRNIITQKITPAFTRLHTFIEKEYLPRCRDTAGLSATPGGAARYAFRARENTTTAMTAEEIHQTGLREVVRIRGELEKVKRQLGFEGDLKAFLESIPRNPKLTPFQTEAEVIEAYRVIQRRVEPLLDKLFSRKPRAALEIRPEPEITRATAAAHYNLGAPDGSRPGVFYAPVRDAATYATPEMTALFLHEGLPGHHYQGSLAQESALPRFRRFTGFTAYGEGWGLYAEGLGDELGVYDDPYQYLGKWLKEMHRAIRLVVDTGMHAKGWSREEAIAYSLENEGGQAEIHTQEVERYMAIPGQALAYKIGELKIKELRRRAEQKLGNRFDVRVFHHELLKDGNLPLAVLEAKINRWLDAQ